jgi:hypothetical protein
VRQPHRPARQLGGEKRTGKIIAVSLDTACHQHPRKRFRGGQLQIGVVLVVAEQDVVARIALLDQVVFECQRLDDRIRDDDLDARGLVEQGVVARAGAIGAQVAAHTIPERTRFAHIEGLARSVRVDVHARLMRQPGHLLLEIVDCHRIRLRVAQPYQPNSQV